VTWVYPLDHAHPGSPSDVTALVGGKAANLGVMRRELGLPVPPGMAVTTAACNAFLAGGWPAGLDAELEAGMRAIEAEVGRRFGDPQDPLLVSVRSGAPVSMPGMMDTILNLGISDATVAGLARVSGDAAFAADCRRRFATMFREIVGVDAPDDPWAQLRLAVEAVFRSWNGARARAYRAKERLPDDAGTGVTIQAMVFGNGGPDSATGVVFTRNPATGEAGLYGDVLFDAQGEDVVAGTHETQPLAVLDARLPAVAARLRECGARLEAHYRDLCDIEFTVERGRLWLLQVRVGKRSPRAALRIALDMALDEGFPLSRREAVERVAPLLADPPLVTAPRPSDATPLAAGLGASPGLATGEIATSPEAAQRAADAGRSPILVRAETSPDDVHGMARAVGILTSRGGLASHAAVVARGWGIPAVVGAQAVGVGDGTVRFPAVTLAEGAEITIDGDTGEVFLGRVPAASAVAPEARTLLEWAAELGVPVGAAGSRGPDPAGGDGPPAQAAWVPEVQEAPAASISEADMVHALRLKGLATPEAVGHTVLATATDVGPLLDALVGGGLAEIVAGAYRLTPGGRERSLALVGEEQAALGMDRAATALDGFLDLDRRVKDTVTAWQLRPADGEPVVNDHSDAAYDAAVLARLGALQAEAAAWIEPLERGWPRARRYRLRLTAAVARSAAGDPRYVASPRVDSYHGTWFELHEDLILLAGRTRADEVAAGRA